MEPLPETVEAVDELDPVADDGELLPALLRLAHEAEDDVPDLFAVSLTRIKEDLTFTLVATDDADVPVVRSGPAGEAGRAAAVPGVAVPDLDAPVGASNPVGDVLDEAGWRVLAERSSGTPIRSTLTLPVLAGDDVVETVTLYAGSDAAFVGHHERLASIFGAWAGGAVTNADLPFNTRDDAKQAPRHVRERIVIDVAIGITAARLGIDVEDAERRLEEAAARAGVGTLEIARRIVPPRRGV